MAYRAADVSLLVVAGKDYGAWLAFATGPPKGPALLGIRAILGNSRVFWHHSNLIGMGLLLPLQFLPGQSADTPGLTGEETYAIHGLETLRDDGASAETVQVRADDERLMSHPRVDTPTRHQLLRHGGIMNYVLRSMLQERPALPDA